MKFLTGFIVFSFIVMAVFSYLGVHFGSFNVMANCLASLMTGSVCPEIGNILAGVNFHLDAFKYFASVAASFIAVLAIVFLAVDFDPASPPPVIAGRNQFFKKDSSAVSRRFRRWLAFHENSPSAF